MLTSSDIVRIKFDFVLYCLALSRGHSQLGSTLNKILFTNLNPILVPMSLPIFSVAKLCLTETKHSELLKSHMTWNIKLEGFISVVA